MYVIGIDPGISGSICFFNDGKILDVIEMPIMTDGKKNKKQVMVRKFIMKLPNELNNLKKIKLELLLNTFLQCLVKALLVCLILDNHLVS